MKKHLLFVSLLYIWILPVDDLEAQSAAFTFQGHLREEGKPADGIFDLRFALYDADSQGRLFGDVTKSATVVRDGLFVATLDFGSIDWSRGDYWMEISARASGATSFVPLLPRQQLTPVPQAIYASNVDAESIAGTIDSSQLAKGSVTAEKLSPSIGVWVQSGANIHYSSGAVGIGTSGPTADLHVRGNGNLGQVVVTPNEPDANSELVLAENASATLGSIMRYDGSANQWQVLGMTNGGVETKPHLIVTRDDGKVGVGISPATALHVSGEIRSSGPEGGTVTVRNPQNENASAHLSWLNNIARVRVGGSGNGAQNGFDVQGISDTSLLRVDGNGNATVRRNLKLGDRVDLRSTETGSDGADLVMRDSSGVITVNLDAHQSGGGSQLDMFNETGTRTVRIDSDETDSGIIQLFRADGSAAITIDADSALGGSLVSAQVMRITGGSDIAEPFDVKGANMKPGMVVSIDPQSPGELMISHEAYDHKVAGIVSGAGGVRPGLTLSQENTLANGQHPVALTGRVYCWVDTDHGGPIEPGDLLTTSATPGHASKVTDSIRAQGAIIGKAMTPLQEGRGLVLVLVSLQ